MSEPSMSPAIPIAYDTGGINHSGQNDTRNADALFGVAVAGEVVP